MGECGQSFNCHLRETSLQAWTERSESLKEFPRLICLIGIDGSGKTTLAKAFVEKADKIGMKYRYVWGNAQPIFIKPLRTIAHLTLLRNVDMQKDNERYEKIKEETSVKHSILSWLYSRILIFDYIIWLFFKVKLPLSLGRRIICDRYVFDVAVNLYFLNKKYFSNIEKTINTLLKYFPEPSLLYLLDVPISVAFKRKNDVPSIGYLEKRTVIYERLGKFFRARKLDGEKSVLDLINTIVKDIRGAEHEQPGRSGQTSRTTRRSRSL